VLYIPTGKWGVRAKNDYDHKILDLKETKNKNML
jgi:hypothetical protein